MDARWELGFGLALLPIALVEVSPRAGRYLPGPYLVCAAGAGAVMLGAFPWRQLAAAEAGAVLRDVLNDRRARLHPRATLVDGTAWGLDSSEARSVRASPFRVAFTRRMVPRDRALLPLVAGAWGTPRKAFILVSAPASLLWGLTWTGWAPAGSWLCRLFPSRGRSRSRPSSCCSSSRPLLA